MAALTQVSGGWSFRHCTAIAATLHLVLALALLPLALSHPLPLPQDDAVRVELVAPPPPARKLDGRLEPEPMAAPQPHADPARSAPSPPQPDIKPKGQDTPAAPAPSRDGLTPARTLYAAKILLDPRSAPALKDLETIDVDEQVVQVCNLEAMEQIERQDPSLKPDFVLAYARDDMRQHGLDITADGAAFHSKDGWYGLRYRCKAKADHRGVSDFAFAVEEAVPEAQWADLNLPSAISSGE
ncbi:DUF930 domain-containing protein [Rhizobium halophytocola]|uniref:DUF930 domain-containing protein n=1 Tax=Rhizobium halophytocola TaxID=735519 RepID=A0ABS4DY49_9HYPH|nr:DUF930 domain-containing protein [Rhizobium halophytocola]MBP1850564.1 hypothetical protein [Rhizobium halophytocola]